MKFVKETVKIRVYKGGAWERVDGALEYMPLNCVKHTPILPLLSSYSCLLEAVFERLEIDANSNFMITHNSDNDIVEDNQSDLANRKLKQVIGSPKTKKPNERNLLDDEKIRPFGEKIMGSVLGKVKSLSGEDVSSKFNDESSKSDEEVGESDDDAETTPVISESSRIYRGKEIMTNMKASFKIDISYSQARRDKCYAFQLLRGTPEESFAELPLYCHNLKLKNHGTITHIETDDEDIFEIFFLAVGFAERVYFPGMRYNHMTSNSAESVNTLFRHSQKLSICMMIDWFIKSLQQWYFEHRQTADEHKRELTPWTEAKLAQRIAKFATWTWQLSGLPFGNLIAVMRHLRQSSANQFAFSCFKTSVWRATYNEVIYDVGHPLE
nr:hypothetical protein [Tanacetum cinerariifolium]